jgi:murein L,D-transpeptidase YcbB/YkuD
MLASLRLSTPPSRRSRFALALLAAAFGGALLLAIPTAVAEDAVATAPIPPAEAPAASAEPAEAAAPQAPPPVNPELKARLEGSGPVIIDGERTHSDLLRRFYAARNYDTVWDKQPSQAEALVAAIGRAEQHGLDPNLFHTGLLQRRGAGLSPLDHELMISDAVLGFADALARGAVPPEERPSTWALKPGPVDPLANVGKVLAAADPVQAIEALAPQTPEYAALQRAYREAHAPAAPAAPAPAGGRGRPVAYVPNAERVKRIAVALERERWLPRQLPATRIWVNTEDAHLDFYQDDRKVFSTRVVVGQPDKQTPEFETHTPSVLFNPPWYVPRSIIAKEIMPKLGGDPSYLARHHMSWHSGGTIRQDPGPNSALGQIKFEMPDPFDVYLHDTPSKGLFASAERHKSHGCVRVEHPLALASLLLNEDQATIGRSVGVGYTHRQALPRPIPVFVVYQTVAIDPNGGIRLLPDVYARDDRVWQLLNRTPQAAVEQVALANRTRG